VHLDSQVAFISDDGFVAAYREDELGNPYIDIWRLTVVKN
jgi:hypothetical protein